MKDKISAKTTSDEVKNELVYYQEIIDSVEKEEHIA